jgi:hypothetical protein
MTFYRTSILLSYTLSRSISKGDWHGEETPFLNRYPEEGLLKEWLSSSQNWIQPFFHPVCVYCLYNWMSAALSDISGPVCPQRFPFKTRFSLVSAWGFFGPLLPLVPFLSHSSCLTPPSAHCAGVQHTPGKKGKYPAESLAEEVARGSVKLGPPCGLPAALCLSPGPWEVTDHCFRVSWRGFHSYN